MNEHQIRVYTDGPLYPIGFGSQIRSWLDNNNLGIRFHVDLVNIDKVDLPVSVPEGLSGYHYVLYDTFACQPVLVIETHSEFRGTVSDFLRLDLPSH